jgi:hypothetical protein
MTGEPRWDVIDGRNVLIQDFEYDGSRTATVEAALKIVLWGGSGESGAQDERGPQVLHWRRSDRSSVAGTRLMLRREDVGPWSAVVLPLPSTVTSIQIREARRDKT